MRRFPGGCLRHRVAPPALAQRRVRAGRLGTRDRDCRGARRQRRLAARQRRLRLPGAAGGRHAPNLQAVAGRAPHGGGSCGMVGAGQAVGARGVLQLSVPGALCSGADCSWCKQAPCHRSCPASKALPTGVRTHLSTARGARRRRGPPPWRRRRRGAGGGRTAPAPPGPAQSTGQPGRRCPSWSLRDQTLHWGGGRRERGQAGHTGRSGQAARHGEGPACTRGGAAERGTGMRASRATPNQQPAQGSGWRGSWRGSCCGPPSHSRHPLTERLQEDLSHDVGDFGRPGGLQGRAAGLVTSCSAGW